MNRPSDGAVIVFMVHALCALALAAIGTLVLWVALARAAPWELRAAAGFFVALCYLAASCVAYLWFAGLRQSRHA